MPIPSYISLFDLANCREDLPQASAEDKFDSSRPYITRSYRRRFLMTALTDKVGPGIVREAAKGLFNLAIGKKYEYGDPLDALYESDELSFCVGIRTIRYSEDGRGWFVDAAYEPIDPLEFDKFENPLLAPIEKRIDTAKFERSLDYDYDDDYATTSPNGLGRPIQNSAGDKFNPGVVRDDNRTVITIVRNEAIYTAQAVGGVLWADAKPETYCDTINKTTTFGRTKHKLKCDAIQGEYLWHPSLYDAGAGYSGYYVRATYVFVANRDTWDRKLVDRGFRTRDASTHKQKPILVLGVPATDPVHLDGSGQVQPPDATTHEIVPVLLPTASGSTGFQVYKEADFVADLKFSAS